MLLLWLVPNWEGAGSGLEGSLGREALILVNWHAIGRVLYYVLFAGLMIYVFNQVRKPDRWAGRFFLWIMNLSHSGVTNWGLGQVRVGEEFTILDVGCGGGRTIEKLAALAPRGMIYGVDYAKGSVAASRGRNTGLIEAGRVEIVRASVSQLPFPDAKFDLVTAVETQYYWPDLVKDMQEILRVLKPGGTLVVIAESYGKARYDMVQGPVMKLLRSANLSVEEHRELFAKAGYTDVQTFEERSKSWFCGVVRKPL
jgi:SAM-dependent methyltransferase